MKSRELLVWAGVLLVCLLAGIAFGRWAAPEPVIGLIRFNAAIEPATATELIELLESTRQDSRVAGVVLEISSPGGLATSAESIFYTMLRLRQEKPLVIFIDGIAVSGGYYMAAAGNRIFTTGSAYVGNIGARGERPTDPALAPGEQSSGPYKLAGGSRFDRIHQLDLVAEAFINNVIVQRQNAEVNPLKLDKRTVAEARIYMGSEAVAVGLVDLEGGRTDAILSAAELAGVTRYRVVNLVDFYRMAAPEAPPDSTVSVRQMVETAPPAAVFLLDTRIPLPGIENDAIERHLLQLRGPAGASPTPLPPQVTPQATSQPTGAGS
jgi:protease-4